MRQFQRWMGGESTAAEEDALVLSSRIEMR